jgi:hypothetical protein
MSTKTKTDKTLIDSANEVAANAGLVLMMAAAAAGFVELPSQHEKKAMLTQQPVYAFAGGQNDSNDGNHMTLRRERDDISPHYVSYSAYQRTPGRTGKI